MEFGKIGNGVRFCSFVMNSILKDFCVYLKILNVFADI